MLYVIAIVNDASIHACMTKALTPTNPRLVLVSVKQYGINAVFDCDACIMLTNVFNNNRHETGK